MVHEDRHPGDPVFPVRVYSKSLRLRRYGRRSGCRRGCGRRRRRRRVGGRRGRHRRGGGSGCSNRGQRSAGKGGRAGDRKGRQGRSAIRRSLPLLILRRLGPNVPGSHSPNSGIERMVRSGCLTTHRSPDRQRSHREDDGYESRPPENEFRADPLVQPASSEYAESQAKYPIAKRARMKPR